MLSAFACHSESFAVILIPQSREKNLALPAQDKLREESRPEYFQDNARFFARPKARRDQNDRRQVFFRSP